MAGSGAGVTVAEAVNRGFNMLVAAFLGLAGLTFGSDLFVETDPIDKLDNALLAVVGVIAVGWYLMGRHRFESGLTPFALAGAALVVQIGAFALEAGDSTAIADDIPGMIIFVTFLIVLAVVRSANRKVVASAPQAPG